MFKKRIWKPLLIGLGWTTCLAGLVVLMSFIAVKKSEVVCKAVKVYIPGSQYFIDRQEVDNILQMSSRTLVGRRIQSIDLHALENKLKRNPFIEFAKVYADMDGVIQVEVSQRQPILRVMNRFDQDFYVDQHGLKMPLSQNFTARVLVANGYIDELFANKVDSLHNALTRDIFRTADFIRKDSLWEAQIAQIYVNQDHEIELIPRVGNQRILLGNADSLQLKFSNLRVFYEQALPMVGWDAYKVINIKYANQVIGVKNQTLLDSLNAEVKAKAAAEQKAKDSVRLASIKQNQDATAAALVTGNTQNAEDAEPAVRKLTEPKPEPRVAGTAAKKVADKRPEENKAGKKPATEVPAANNTINPDALYKPKASLQKANKPGVPAAGKPAAVKPTEKKTDKKTAIKK